MNLNLFIQMSYIIFILVDHDLNFISSILNFMFWNFYVSYLILF